MIFQETINKTNETVILLCDELERIINKPSVNSIPTAELSTLSTFVDSIANLVNSLK